MKKLIPYVTLGFPTKRGCLDLLRACAAGGADAVELGIPFSDPLADGPVIQAASQRALAGGATMDDAFEVAAKFRDVPLYFMTYLNPVLRYGPARFFARADAAGAIIPDLPPEEATKWTASARIPVVFLCSPTCTDERIRLIDRRSRAWIYLVSLKGVTGTRAKLAPDLAGFVRRVRRFTAKPLHVGFGISTPEQAARVAEVADGVIVGSALLRRVLDGAGPREIERFVASLKRAIRHQPSAVSRRRWRTRGCRRRTAEC